MRFLKTHKFNKNDIIDFIKIWIWIWHIFYKKVLKIMSQNLFKCHRFYKNVKFIRIYKIVKKIIKSHGFYEDEIKWKIQWNGKWNIIIKVSKIVEKWYKIYKNVKDLKRIMKTKIMKNV